MFQLDSEQSSNVLIPSIFERGLNPSFGPLGNPSTVQVLSGDRLDIEKVTATNEKSSMNGSIQLRSHSARELVIHISRPSLQIKQSSQKLSIKRSRMDHISSSLFSISSFSYIPLSHRLQFGYTSSFNHLISTTSPWNTRSTSAKTATSSAGAVVIRSTRQ